MRVAGVEIECVQVVADWRMTSKGPSSSRRLELSAIRPPLPDSDRHLPVDWCPHPRAHLLRRGFRSIGARHRRTVPPPEFDRGTFEDFECALPCTIHGGLPSNAGRRLPTDNCSLVTAGARPVHIPFGADGRLIAFSSPDPRSARRLAALATRMSSRAGSINAWLNEKLLRMPRACRGKRQASSPGQVGCCHALMIGCGGGETRY
jgi:hypothetical protein